MTRCLDTEEYEHFLHCEVIENNFAFLCDNINPSDHVDFLRSLRVLDQETVEDILSQTTTRQRCRSFLGYLKRRGPTALPLFIKSLMENRTQVYVAKRLHLALEGLQNNPPPSVLARKPRSAEENEEFGSRMLEESDERMSVEENHRTISARIEDQLPIPGQPGAISLPGVSSYHNNTNNETATKEFHTLLSS